MKKSFLKTGIASAILLATCLTSCGGQGSGWKAFKAAQDGEEVTVETYIQAKFYYNAWGNFNFYAQDSEGAYYGYRYYCTEAEYNAIEIGQKVKITGKKASYAGEVEFGEATISIELLDGNWKATPIDVTKYAGTASMIDYQNRYIKYTNLTVVPENDSGEAVRYKGENDDIYFVGTTPDGVKVNFCVESDFTNSSTDVYKKVGTLKVGDKIDVEGFCNWWDEEHGGTGANPHVTKLTIR